MLIKNCGFYYAQSIDGVNVKAEDGQFQTKELKFQVCQVLMFPFQIQLRIRQSPSKFWARMELRVMNFLFYCKN
ncbi:unnamed protein product [Paramecium octaurelia]|uniref:Uncharacterized protein n=1 Tax=Paramecium octaurelia TaxID=43137 RepID=A0A8S1TYQ1_PAROT|nr:unnamed protein product [Paramecium octaurelia]CAD8157995.1 unnamed protein product [Paramecium octaurelia]CAD8157997.1 unnamed protein product [Paramecium octaurelia]